MAFAFEKLVVYQKSVGFADEICRQTEQLPGGYGFLVDQLNRAALLIAAPPMWSETLGESVFAERLLAVTRVGTVTYRVPVF